MGSYNRRRGRAADLAGGLADSTRGCALEQAMDHRGHTLEHLLPATGLPCLKAGGADQPLGGQADDRADRDRQHAERYCECGYAGGTISSIGAR